MLSKRILKYIKSLQLKKYRRAENSFLVEGAKGVTELLESDYEIRFLLHSEAFKEFDPQRVQEVIQVSEEELARAGTFQSNNTALAVAKMKSPTEPTFENHEITLVLDDVRDPGNLGTIIRIADWYGVSQIICSRTCADFYNSKVINSSMGSFTRINICYTDLQQILAETNIPVYGALLEGDSIYQQKMDTPAIVLMGNESQGIREELKAHISQPIHIPRRGGAESLNVAIATAVILDNFFR